MEPICITNIVGKDCNNTNGEKLGTTIELEAPGEVPAIIRMSRIWTVKVDGEVVQVGSAVGIKDEEERTAKAVKNLHEIWQIVDADSYWDLDPKKKRLVNSLRPY